MKLTHQRLLQLLNYNPETGEFTWAIRVQYRKIGHPVGGKRRDGYFQIQLDGEKFLQHRLAWFYVHGKMPDFEIDHEDRDPSNNRIKNLRIATKKQQNGNAKVRSDSVSGIRGVRLLYGKWQARIKLNEKRVTLGRYNSKEEAQDAYRKAALESWKNYCAVPSAWVDKRNAENGS